MLEFENPWILVLFVGGAIAFLFIFMTNRSRMNNEDEGQNGENESRSEDGGISQSMPVPGTKAPLIGTMAEGYVGVVYRFGKITGRLVKPGFYIRLPLPFIYEIIYVSIQRDVIDLPRQSVAIESGAQIGVEHTLVIRVTDPRTLLEENRDYKQVIRELARQVGVARYRGVLVEQLGDPKVVMDEELLQMLNAKLEGYGAVVEAFALADYSLSERLQESVEQVIQARKDAEAATIEVKMAATYLKAAEEYALKGVPGMSKQEVALELRRLATYKDIKGASMLVPTHRG